MDWSTIIKYYRDVVGSIQTLLTRATGLPFTGWYESSNGETLQTSLENDTHLQFATEQQVSDRVSRSLDT